MLERRFRSTEVLWKSHSRASDAFPDDFYVETVIRSHALLHLSSRMRRHFLPRAYITICIVAKRQLLSCVDFFRESLESSSSLPA